tara:strand:+ start:10375 stop:10923 length:549 start_codon:yes stop_codon:yes gene_type:complete
MNAPFNGINYGIRGTNVGGMTPEQSHRYRNTKHEYTNAEMTPLLAAQTMFENELRRKNNRFISHRQATNAAGITSAVIIVAGMITMLAFAVLYFARGDMGTGFGFLGGSIGMILSIVIIFPIAIGIARFLVPSGDTRAAKEYRNTYNKHMHAFQNTAFAHGDTDARSNMGTVGVGYSLNGQH